MRNVYKSGLLIFLRGAACLVFLTVSALCGARADDVACEPAKLAAKYPSLAGRTIKVGQDGESVPFSMRDPKDFSKLIGLDADLAQATFACIGVPMQFVIGTWAGLIPAAMTCRAACASCRTSVRIWSRSTSSLATAWLRRTRQRWRARS